MALPTGTVKRRLHRLGAMESQDRHRGGRRMLTYTYGSGLRLERHFCGSIVNEEDVAKITQEIKEELNDENGTLYVEIWKEVPKILKKR